MSWSLRRAGPEDAPVLAAILSDWIDATDWMPRLHSHADDLTFVTGLVTAGRVTALDDEGGPMGFLGRSGPTVEALYVAPAARGQGGGKALLDHAKAVEPRLSLWTFAANEGARRFYLREGFEETGRTAGDNAEGLPDIHMTWEAAR